jgi:hypothetical protein
MDSWVMTRIGYIILSVLSGVYALLLYLKFNQINVPSLVSSYLADLISMPILLSATLVLLRWIKRLPHFLFNWKHVLFAWAYVCVVFEWYLPSRSSTYTSDPVDVLVFGISGLIFLLLQPKLFLSFKADDKTTP